MDFSACKIVVAWILLCQLAVADTGGVLITGSNAEEERRMQVTQVRVVAAGSKARLRAVIATFEPHQQTQGWNSPGEAAVAFYRAHNAAYLSTASDAELAGFLLLSDTGQFFFTNAADVPSAFILQARVYTPLGWRVQGFLHTHPGGSKDQDFFSENDQRAVLKGARDYFLRAPGGDVRFMNTQLAKSTRMIAGARGQSVCPEKKPCLNEHPRHNQPTAEANWRPGP